MEKANNFSTDESGATAVEYSLLVALIVVVLIVALNTLGTTFRTMFNRVSTALGS